MDSSLAETVLFILWVSDSHPGWLVRQPGIRRAPARHKSSQRYMPGLAACLEGSLTLLTPGCPACLPDLLYSARSQRWEVAQITLNKVVEYRDVLLTHRLENGCRGCHNSAFRLLVCECLQGQPRTASLASNEIVKSLGDAVYRSDKENDWHNDSRHHCMMDFCSRWGLPDFVDLFCYPKILCRPEGAGSRVLGHKMATLQAGPALGRREGRS